LYEEALCHEFALRKIRFERQKLVPISYKGMQLGVPLRLDLIVEEKVIVDLKAKEAVLPGDFFRHRPPEYLRKTEAQKHPKEKSDKQHERNDPKAV